MIEVATPISSHMAIPSSNDIAAHFPGKHASSISVVQVTFTAPSRTEPPTGVAADDTGIPQDKVIIEAFTEPADGVLAAANADDDVCEKQEDVNLESLTKSVITEMTTDVVGTVFEEYMAKDDLAAPKDDRKQPKKEPVCKASVRKRRRRRRKHTVKEQVDCEVCGLVCTSPAVLRTHVRVHTGERPFKCEFCNTSFARNSELRIHRRSHTGERPYQCDFCGKMFAKGSALTSHKRTHTGDKPYSCRLCNKTFTQSQHLKGHQLTHTGLKKYQCDVCGRPFGGNSALTRHKHIHAKDVRYKCTLCSKSYSRNHELALHTKRVHESKSDDASG